MTIQRRKGKPNDLRGIVHDRRSTDLLRNSKTAAIEIDDPYEIGGKIVTLRSIRNDPLAGLHARGFIDEAQYQGGRAFQHDFEIAEQGPRAIDPSKESVDGGKSPEPITDARLKATDRLIVAERALGQNGSSLIHDVLIARMSIDQICAARGLKSQRENDYIGKRFRECLECLAVIYGFASKKCG
jgi:hypothetical protein